MKTKYERIFAEIIKDLQKIEEQRLVDFDQMIQIHRDTGIECSGYAQGIRHAIDVICEHVENLVSKCPECGEPGCEKTIVNYGTLYRCHKCGVFGGIYEKTNP